MSEIIKELIPDEYNNRNSEGSFIELSNKDILFVYSRYGDCGLDDDATSDLYGILSHDNGDSFGEPFPVLLHQDLHADNLMSVSFMRMNNGDIGMFFLKKNNKDGETLCMPHFVRSHDNGKTWSKPVCCVNEDGFYVLNNDRMLKLDSGRILMPLARRTKEKVYAVSIYGSDDDGNSWKCFVKDIRLPISVWRYPYGSTAEEPGLVVFDDGTVWCYIRTVLGHQYEMFSSDDGSTWTTPQPSQFTSPASPMSVKKLRSSELFAVWNPIPMYNGKSNEHNGVWIGGRNPLCFSVLDKNGVIFQPAEAGLQELPIKVTEIENDENRGFCYTAIYELENGDVLLGYCAGKKFDHCLSTIRIRKIKKSEIK